MIYPVKVMNARGTVKRIISSKALEKRSDMILQAGETYRPDDPVREFKCVICHRYFWGRSMNRGGKEIKYCPGGKCKDKATNQVRKERRELNAGS